MTKEQIIAEMRAHLKAVQELAFEMEGMVDMGDEVFVNQINQGLSIARIALWRWKMKGI